MLPIETERLILRRFTMQDAEDIYAFSADPFIARYLKGFPGTTIKDVQEYIYQQNRFEPGEPESCFDLAVELKNENKVIGLVTIINHEEMQGEVGFALNVAYQRLGYATEALRAAMEFGYNELDFHRIFSRTSRQNINSWMLLERVGMRREAIFLQDHQENDQWNDTFLYAMLKSEWATNERRSSY